MSTDVWGIRGLEPYPAPVPVSADSLVLTPSRVSWGPVDVTTPFTGTRLVEDGVQLAEAIRTGDWLSGSLAGVAGVFDTVMFAVDPIGQAIAMGVGWVLDHVSPLREWFNELTGDAAAVSAASGTWSNISQYLAQCQGDLARVVESMLDELGYSAETFRKLVEEVSEHLGMVSLLADGISTGLAVASTIVQIVHDLVRDAIGDIVGQIASAAIIEACTLGLATPYVVTKISILVGRWVTRIGTKIRDVVHSIEALKALFTRIQPLLAKLRSLFDQIGGVGRSVDTWARDLGVNIGRRPGSVGPSAQNIQGWIRDVNPLFDRWDPDSPWSNNCGSCAINTWDALSDHPVVRAGPSRTGVTVGEIEVRIGRPMTPMSPSDLSDGLIQAGPGSHAVVGVIRPNGYPGHAFNAYFDGHRVYYVDGQIATIYRWPPTNLGNVVQWVAAIFGP